MTLPKWTVRALSVWMLGACGACAQEPQPSGESLPHSFRILGKSLSTDDLKAVPFHKVKVDDVFWSPRVKTTLTSTLDACLVQCEKTGRIENFAVAAGRSEAGHQGFLFNDSDVYKILEGAAYSLSFDRDPAIEKRIDGIIDLIAASQQKDGYLNTYYTARKPKERWKNIAHGHELYCAGHLIEAGIAYKNATGKRKLFDVAVRFADYIDAQFGQGKRIDPPGHQEIELALIKLHDETGNARYGKLARFFLEQRGRHEGRQSYKAYSQDHVPVRQQDKAVGHSVRAMYQACALADVARQDGDDELRKTLEALWNDIHDGKIYVTGGIGAVAGIEGFAPSYILPNDTAYAETCAAIAIAMFDHRMYLLSGKDHDMRYIDGMETALYNGMLSGVSLQGDRFFYRNPLGSRGDRQRSEWFSCACCPSNVVRFVPAIGGMIYAHDARSIDVLLFVGSKTTIPLAAGNIAIEQTGAYPWKGDVEIRVDPEREAEFGLRLRIPKWCGNRMTLHVNGEEKPVPKGKGSVVVRRRWRKGDVCSVRIPLEVRRVHDDPRVKTNLGRVSLQRGPLIYCLEGQDHGGRSRNLAIPADAKLAAMERRNLLGGIVTIEGTARARTDEATVKDVLFRAVPYYAWNNRGKGEMVTWIPETVDLAEIPGRGATVKIAGREVWASHCWGSDTVKALADGVLPKNSTDHSIPRLTFWPRRGTEEFVYYRFAAKRTAKSCLVYWFDDEPRRGGCRTPASWRLVYRDGDAWKPVELIEGSTYGTAKDRMVETRFAPVESREFRIEVKLRKGFSAGVLEWQLGG